MSNKCNRNSSPYNNIRSHWTDRRWKRIKSITKSNHREPYQFKISMFSRLYRHQSPPNKRQPSKFTTEKIWDEAHPILFRPFHQCNFCTVWSGGIKQGWSLSQIFSRAVAFDSGRTYQCLCSPCHSNNPLAQVDEFLKLKPARETSTITIGGAKRKEQIVKLTDASPAKKQQKINWVLASPMQSQQPKVQAQTLTAANTLVANAGAKTQTISLQDLKFYSNNKCLVPITLKDGSNNDQQIMAQIDSKNLVFGTQPGTYLQMKLQPQMTTVDGQQVIQLASATNSPTSIALTSTQQPQFVQSQIQLPQQIQTATLQPAQLMSDSRTLFTTIQQSSGDQSNTIDTNLGKVQFTTLQNVATPNVTHPLPQGSTITYQRIKVDPEKKVTHTTTAKKQDVPKFVSNRTITSRRPAANRSTANATKTPTTQTANGTAANSTTASGDTPKSDAPTCEICSKVFKRKEHLAQHTKLHLGLRPFRCEEPNCNKTFSRKEHLMRHCVSHTGKKQFDCDICHKLFSRKDNLNKHKRYCNDGTDPCIQLQQLFRSDY